MTLSMEKRQAIATDEENARAIAELERLDSLPEMTVEQRAKAKSLTLSIEQYEQKYDLGHADPLDALRTLMEDRLTSARPDPGFRIEQRRFGRAERKARDQ